MDHICAISKKNLNIKADFINYHKDIRSKGAISSILDNIDGIGEVRKKNILKNFCKTDRIFYIYACPPVLQV